MLNDKSTGGEQVMNAELRNVILTTAIKRIFELIVFGKNGRFLKESGDR